MAEIRIDGLDALDRALAELPKAIAKRVAGNAVRAGARVIATEAKAQVPVLTGALRDSIVVRAARRGRAQGVVKAVVGFLRPASRIAHLVEFGTSHSAAEPFLRPALDGKGGEAVDKMKAILRAGVEREAQRLHRP